MNKKKLIRVIVIVLVAFIIMNTIATKIIYDTIFGPYHKEADYELEPYDAFCKLGNQVSFLCQKNELAGYYYDREDSKELIVIAPGLHSGAMDYTCLAQAFYEGGYDVFSFDPTGTGLSQGASNIGYNQETYDLDAALTYVENNLSYEHLLLVGHSRGATAVCSMLARTKETIGIGEHEITAVVASSGFDSAMDAVIGIPERYAGPVVNFNYPTLWLYQRILFKEALLNLRITDVLQETTVPVLVIQGQNDKVASAKKHSIYANREHVSNPVCTFFLQTKKDYDGHTSVLYDYQNRVATLNEDSVRYILDFFAKACV